MIRYVENLRTVIRKKVAYPLFGFYPPIRTSEVMHHIDEAVAKHGYMPQFVRKYSPKELP